MEKTAVKQKIVDYLKYRDWVSGLELEMQSLEWYSKPSTISRRCRELADSEAIERRLIGKTVQYRKKIPEHTQEVVQPKQEVFI